MFGPWPGLYAIHGGGMVTGDRRAGTAESAEWADEFGLVAVSVECRPAPEHPHPAPVEDCSTGGFHGFDILALHAAVSRAARRSLAARTFGPV